MLYSWIAIFTIFKQNVWKCAYLIRMFKVAVGYHGNITLANYMQCILAIYYMCVPVVYGKCICHHSKFLLGVWEQLSKSQKCPDHTDIQCQNGQTAMS